LSRVIGWGVWKVPSPLPSRSDAPVVLILLSKIRSCFLSPLKSPAIAALMPRGKSKASAGPLKLSVPSPENGGMDCEGRPAFCRFGLYGAVVCTCDAAADVKSQSPCSKMVHSAWANGLPVSMDQTASAGRPPVSGLLRSPRRDSAPHRDRERSRRYFLIRLDSVHEQVNQQLANTAAVPPAGKLARDAHVDACVRI